MPTTVIPITAPLKKATRRAAFSPRIALAAVRPLARTATLMPMNPAAAEQIVPARYAIAVLGMSSSLEYQSTKTHTAANTITMKGTSTTYSRRRKAYAPSRMASPMRLMWAFPSSTIITRMVRAAAKAKAAAPQITAIRMAVITYLQTKN